MSAGPPGSDVILERLLALHPKIIDLTLERLERLLARLGHPERDLPPVVHIAGTNGKGSTLAVIDAGLAAAGLSAHAYTSPHLARFHERIRIAGAPIGEDALAALLAECEGANGGAPITFFEITTAAALLAFARNRADYTLLEVGLGGRLDATNVVARPALTVITPVSIDHQQYLGETIAEIAAEKAGILKAGVPCVVGPQDEAALGVIEARAAACGAPLSLYAQDWMAGLEAGRFVFRDANGLLDMAPPALRGAHQVDNAGAGVAALRALGVDDAAVEVAPARAVWPARIQRLTKGALAEVAAAAEAELWLDGGHNQAAGVVIAAHFKAMPKAETHLVCGMLDTKDPAGFIGSFRGVAARLHAVAIPDNLSAVKPAALAAFAESAGVPATAEANVAEALARALDEGAKRVLICGSLYLAGAVLKAGAG
ncbi:bifunctional folylpolyglutamate synthase/dihydrofolate synthase [Pikeienuella piscinae]|uniref:tetrahydrofolate synthase n=1 Tax=Pikeienuella piscinae TaxID=2748098 RepID=A0A7L5C3S7_9RHOB|nr:Mur ligase family protein [Pikeienuella piscinae]QIE57116.1 bifunctional folylpolyglutamate synthase/dihydrofolate synthase [Pikeienuella piscinae]